MADVEKVKYDIERCICHVPDACRDCSHYKHGEYLDCMEELLKDALAMLKEQPEIIRCKDCKHWNADEHDCNIKIGWFVCGVDWFCADGERKDGDGDADGTAQIPG